MSKDGCMGVWVTITTKGKKLALLVSMTYTITTMLTRINVFNLNFLYNLPKNNTMRHSPMTGSFNGNIKEKKT